MYSTRSEPPASVPTATPHIVVGSSALIKVIRPFAHSTAHAGNCHASLGQCGEQAPRRLPLLEHAILPVWVFNISWLWLGRIW